MTTNELYQEHFECVCGVHLITLERFGDDTDVDIVFWEQPYYSGSRIREYFRRLWAALRNKRYMIYNVILSQDDAKRLAISLLDVMERDITDETIPEKFDENVAELTKAMSERFKDEDPEEFFRNLRDGA